jgi:superfamily II DNA or RNA helicase
MTRKQAGVDTKKVKEIRSVEMNPVQKRMYKELDQLFQATLTSGEIVRTKHVISKLLWQSRVAGGCQTDGSQISSAKLKEIINLLNTELKGEQVLVWFRFNAEIAHAAKAFADAGFAGGVITGLTSDDDRVKIHQAFQANKVQLLLMQIKCGKFALDYSNARTAIYYSNGYDAEDRYQSEDRIISADRRDPVLYIDMVTEGTVDEQIVRALKGKRLRSSQFLEKILMERYGYSGKLAG